MKTSLRPIFLFSALLLLVTYCTDSFSARAEGDLTSAVTGEARDVVVPDANLLAPLTCAQLEQKFTKDTIDLNKSASLYGSPFGIHSIGSDSALGMPSARTLGDDLGDAFMEMREKYKASLANCAGEKSPEQRALLAEDSAGKVLKNYPGLEKVDGKTCVPSSYPKGKPVAYCSEQANVVVENKLLYPCCADMCHLLHEKVNGKVKYEKYGYCD
jgi:hypothetical protein